MSRRHGSMLIEATIAIVMLGMTFAAIAQLAVFVGQQRKQIEFRSTASRVASSGLERLMSVPRDQLAETTLQLSQDQELVRGLPGGRLTAEAWESPDQPEVSQLRVSVAWQDRSGATVEPVRLSAWKYQPLSSDEGENQ